MELETAQKRDLLFTNRVQGNTVFMLLDKGIGREKNSTDPFILGSAFAEELYYWKSQGKEITVKINCPGGSVFDGWSMIDAIRENGANTENVGIAASMGGVCLMFGKHRSSYDYARIMVHAPRGGNKNYLDVVKSQFRDLLESRTKFTKAEIDDIMDSGKDYWFTAKEAKDKGIIDEVIPTGKVFNLSEAQISDTRALYLVYNSALQQENLNNSNQIEMEIFNKIFGGKSEPENAMAAMQMKAENDQLKAAQAKFETEKKALEDKVKALEDAGKTNEVKAKATVLIEGAVTSGKMTFKDDAEKALAIDSAVANFDLTKKMIDAIPTKKTVAAVAIPNEGDKTKNTYEWLAKNDPKKLAAIAESDPELFNKLSDEYNELQLNKNEVK